MAVDHIILTFDEAALCTLVTSLEANRVKESIDQNDMDRIKILLPSFVNIRQVCNLSLVDMNKAGLDNMESKYEKAFDTL